MSAMIEITERGASFAENGKRERAWHGLGQVVDEPMFVKDALKLCHADFNVGLQKVVALSEELQNAMDNGEFINAAMLRDLLVDNTMATMRLDTNKSLGIVSDKYGIVQNEDAFKFVDMLRESLSPQSSHSPSSSMQRETIWWICTWYLPPLTMVRVAFVVWSHP